VKFRFKETLRAGLLSATGSNWNLRPSVSSLGGDGIHGFEVTLPRAGSYRMIVSAPSLGFGSETLALFTLEGVQD
jgi:hypothetical protein